MKEFRVRFIGGSGQEYRREFDTMEQAQEFCDGRTETGIQKWDPEAGRYKDVEYPIYEF